ncbi:MAG: GNAT family N-acetyltransferase [Planctomycetia bacterium]
MDVADPVADRAACADLCDRCAAHPCSGEPVPKSLAAELRSRPGRAVLGWVARPVAPSDGRLVLGFVTLVIVSGPPAERFSLGWLVVDPAFRHRGVGRALVARAMHEASGLGAAEIHVETLDSWPAAVAFWQATQLAAQQAVARLQASGESRKTAEG